MTQNNPYELVLSEGRRPMWHNVFGALGFTIVLFALGYMAFLLCENDITENLIRSCGSFMYMIGLGMAMIIGFSSTSTIFIDIDTQSLKTRYFVGPFTFNSKKILPGLAAVAILRNNRNLFQVGLCYGLNKFYGLTVFPDQEAAAKLGKLASEKLSIPLLNNHHEN